ncbi:MAG: hypothetical protein JXR76_07035 [Deltaproteobacteria bacterium]|nr:hypothetical protein [Deltaproteobacteria bacterium]
MTSYKKRIVFLLLMLSGAVCIVYFFISMRSATFAPNIQDKAGIIVNSDARASGSRKQRMPEIIDNTIETDNATANDIQIYHMDTAGIDSERLSLPEPGTNATRRVIACVQYGSDETQLGFKTSTTEENLPPQGFTVTSEGKLLVLDTFN